jgi:diguanylate cyclase (GGDEF)-like protein
LKAAARLSASNAGLLGGFILGFGAPAGSLLVRCAPAAGPVLDRVLFEINAHPFHYAYMTVATPLVFAGFGWALGRLQDRLRIQGEILENLNALLKQQSMMDETTDVYDRRYVLNEVEREVERSKRYGRALSVMRADVDGFRQMNDEYGKLAGDHILKEVAQAVVHNVRKVDTVGRLEADEFLVVLPGAKSGDAKRIADRVKRSVREHPIQVRESRLAATVTVGVHTCTDPNALHPATLVEKAGEALSEAKQSGKDSVVAT